MSVVKEVITEGIEYWSPPLKKHRYNMSCLEKRAFIPNDSPSGILMQHIHEREKAYSGIPAYKDENDDENIVSGSETNEVAESIKPEYDAKKQTKRRFRVIKRIEELIYDDSAVKQGELEDEAFELLNADGFYDEILPIDFDENNRAGNKIHVRSLVLYLGVLLILVGIIAATVIYMLF